MWAWLTGAGYEPHGACYLWTPGLIAVHAAADGLIALAYFSIPVALVYFVRKRPDVPFGGIFWMFGLFIIACGTTHLLSIFEIWHGAYWLSATVKVVTAIASVATAVMLAPVIPSALKLRSASELEAVNAELESFSYSVSHDLRAPVRAIAGYAAMVEEDCAAELSDEGLRLLRVVQEEAARMGQLIDDVLALSRLGRKRAEQNLVEMTALVRAIAQEESARADRGDLEIGIELLPDVCGDPVLLRQVWTNLIANAIKFSRGRDRPVIHVSGALDRGEAIYRIEDNGVGFDERYAAKLFQIFQRLHRDDEFPGTGVGLAIAQRAVALHGGRIWAHSRIDEGATFSFALPVVGRRSRRFVSGS